MAEPLLNIRIVTPKAVVFEGKALSISSTNSKGKFDILSKHANFITIVERKPITIRAEGGKRLTFNFPVSIISNVRNHVNIYTDISLK